jgi:hypothetical protein
MMPIPLFFGLLLHWGEPQHLTKIRSFTGAIAPKNRADKRCWDLRFTDHHIVRWYGFSFRQRFFFGWHSFGATTNEYEIGPIPEALSATTD